MESEYAPWVTAFVLPVWTGLRLRGVPRRFIGVGPFSRQAGWTRQTHAASRTRRSGLRPTDCSTPSSAMSSASRAASPASEIVSRGVAACHPDVDAQDVRDFRKSANAQLLATQPRRLDLGKT